MSKIQELLANNWVSPKKKKIFQKMIENNVNPNMIQRKKHSIKIQLILKKWDQI